MTLCAGSGDVAEVLAFARRSEIPLAVRSGGHCFIGRSSTEGIVLDLTAMHAVSVGDGTATVEAGTRLGELYELCGVLRISVSGDAREPPVVSMVGVVLGSLSQTEDDLAEFVEQCGRQPMYRSLDTVEAGGGLKRSAATMDSVVSEESGSRAVFSKSEFFRRPLTPGAVAALLRNLSEDRPPGESRELSFTPMGGRYNDVWPQATAFVHREEQFLIEHVATTAADGSDSAARAARSWGRTLLALRA